MTRTVTTQTRIIATLGLLLGIAASSVSAQSVFDDRGSDFSFGGVTFPSVVDTLAVMQTIRYANTDLGIALQYRTPLDGSARFDLYVYPVREEPGSDDAEVLRAEFDRSLREMEQYAEQNPRVFELIGEEHDTVTVVDASGVAREGWRAVADVRERGLEQTSFLYVFLEGDSYLKYRIAYAASLESTMRPRVEDFVSQTLAEVSVEGRD